MSETRKINVLMVLPDLSIGGVSMVVLDICNLIDKNVFHVEILLLSKNTEALNIKQLSNDVNIHFIDYEFVSNYSIAGYYKYIFLSKSKRMNCEKFSMKIKELHPDIIHFHTHPVDLYLGDVAKKQNIPLLYTDHLIRLENGEYSKAATFFLNNLYKKLYSDFNIISVSQAVAQSIENFGLRGNCKFNHVVNNSVDTDLFHNTSRDDNNFVAVYVSRIAKIKGHEDLVRAWGLMKYNGSKKLVIAGPDSLNGSIQKLVNELGLNESIIMNGPTSHVKELLIEANVAVFPSHKEGLPISLLEKMSMSLPVIVSDIPELTTIIKHNVNGLVFKKGAVQELAEKMDELAMNVSLRERLGNEGRKTVIEHYSKKNEIKEISGVYKKMLSNNKM